MAPPRRAAARLAAVLLLAVAGTPAVAARRGAEPAVLGNGTSIAWSGTKGLLLRVPADTTLPRYGARLFVRGGTHAMVRYRLHGRACGWLECPPVRGIDYVREATPMLRPHDGPGTDHMTSVGYERELDAGLYEVYLFTDGAATLTFDGIDLPRAPRTYRPADRVDGGAAELPVTCSGAACDPDSGYAGRLRVGGRQVKVGRLGNVDMFVLSLDQARPPTWQFPQSHAVRACIHPHNPRDRVSAEPADHPWGCPMTGDDPEETAFHASKSVDAATGAVPLYNGYGTTDRNVYASGTVYAGHQAFTAHDVSKPVVAAYVVWFTYGLR